MKFLIDAQLPLRVAMMFRYRGYDALHTSELPQGNRTTDTALNRLSMKEQRVVVTKDRDFIASLRVQGVPYKLLFVNTGNITNTKLLEYMAHHFDILIQALHEGRFVELTASQVIVYE